MAGPMVKGCNAGSRQLKLSLRAYSKTAIRVVAPLAKGAALAGEARLATGHFAVR